MSSLHQLTRSELAQMASALADGVLMPPFSRTALLCFIRKELAAQVAAELSELNAKGMTTDHLSLVMTLLSQEREALYRARDEMALVWSGPEVLGTTSRDTSVVVRELFREVENEILISTYAIYDGKSVFQELVTRMQEKPKLRVRMLIHIGRDRGDLETSDAELLQQFALNFKQQHWPPNPLPEVYYDPRTLSKYFDERASLHAKCIVVDDQKAFVSSANFTEAAQKRNIEAGVLITNSQFARSLRMQFEVLITQGILKRVPGI